MSGLTRNEMEEEEEGEARLLQNVQPCHLADGLRNGGEFVVFEGEHIDIPQLRDGGGDGEDAVVGQIELAQLRHQTERLGEAVKAAIGEIELAQCTAQIECIRQLHSRRQRE